MNISDEGSGGQENEDHLGSKPRLWFVVMVVLAVGGAATTVFAWPEHADMVGALVTIAALGLELLRQGGAKVDN